MENNIGNNRGWRTQECALPGTVRIDRTKERQKHKTKPGKINKHPGTRNQN